ncbi:MAG TPA: ribonucleotide reductase N-terminal alpha domain-containing protein, partial [Limnochordales bacterium]
MTKEHPKYPQKEVGVVEAVNGDDITVRLRSGEVITQKRSRIDRPLETRPEDMWDRMARAIVAVEPKEKRKELEKEFRWLLQDWRFVPGGRINAMLGTGQNLTAYNCYVIPIRPDDPSYGNDSRRAIMD